jgi:Leucine-rich repeat (LRR) protein
MSRLVRHKKVKPMRNEFYPNRVVLFVWLLAMTQISLAQNPLPGNSIQLNGTSDFITTSVNADPTAMPTTTWEAWVYPTNVTSFRQTIFTNDDGGFDRGVIVDQGVNFGIFVSAGSWQPVAITPNQWQHIAVVYTPTNVFFYKDGVEYAYGSAAGTGPTTNYFTIGLNPSFGEAFTGKIDEVRVWNVARTQSEIQSARNTTLAGAEPGLVAYYKLDETGQGAGITVANSATATGATLNGTTQGTGSTPVFTSTAINPTPPSGNSINLNGLTDYVSVPDNVALKPASVTVEAYVRVNSFTSTKAGGNGNFQFILHKQNTRSTNFEGYTFSLDETNKRFYGVVSSVGGVSGFQVSPNNSIVLGQWYHLALTVNSTELRFYVNGVQQGAAVPTGFALDYGTNPFFIGRSGDLSYEGFLNGQVDEVRIWNTVRTQSEIHATINTTLAGTEPGLVAYYKLDETGQGAGITVANSATATGAALDGTTQGTGSTPVFTESTPGDNSIKFNGSNQSAQLGNWFNYQNFTISMWVKPGSSQVQYAGIIDNNHDGGSGANWVFQQDNFNTNNYYFWANFSQVNVTLAADVWQQVTLVADGSSSTLSVYINGTLAGSTYFSGIFYNGAQTLQVANWAGGGRNWNGELEEVKIYDRALSATEIQNGIYTEESPSAPNLQAYYKMNETSGSIIVDSSPNGRNGTLINSPTFQPANLPAAPPAPTISSFTPVSAGIGSIVNINGANFSATPASNNVKFNNTIATVTASTTTSITTKVPVGATTGTISVTVGANTATSAGSFTVLPKTVITADSLALVAFYNSTNGPSWFNRSNWLTGSVNTWFGVTVASNRVTRLDLLSNNLTGSIPAEIGNLTGLTTRLDLSFNSLTGSIPSQIGQLTSLTNLGIAQNQLSGNVPPELGNLTLLTVLNISRNLLTGALPASIGALPNLSTIGLNENSFTSIPQFISTSIILFNVYTNKLTFEDLEPNDGISGFNYTPQKVLPGQADQFVPLGQTLTITYAVGGASNIYQWAKDGTDIPGATSATYSKPNITLTDNGSYILKITNSLATGLTLTTQPILVNPPQNALNFVGASSDQVIIPNASILNPTTELTIEAWVNLPNVLNNQKIVGKTNFNGYLMGVANGGIYNEIWNGGGNGIIAGTILPNEWTHLAVTFKSGANMVSYINGVQVNSIAVGPNPIDASFGSLLIGNSYGYFATGTIDEVALWNVARTQAEIQADLLGSITPTANLIAYFDFNQGIAGGNNAGITTITDKSTYSNNGTLSTFSLTGPNSNWVSGFQLPPAPTITGISPIGGPVGTTVTITGTNFSTTPANNIVKFNGTDAIVIASTATTITTTVPLGATTGPIAVTVNSQTAISSSSYVVGTPPPVITSINPSFGPVGTTITITGTNFSPTPANNIVKFNGTTAVVTASTATSITTTVPVGATTGKITVTVNSQTATSASDFTFGNPAPTISSFSPFSGAEGTTVTISGSYFSATPSDNVVKFNGTAATVSSSTTTSIVTAVPVGATSGTITVTRDGLSGTSAGNFTINVSAADSLALVTLYTATNGAGWTKRTNWLIGKINTWFGVTVTNGKITSLSLPSNNLANSLPAELSTLDELTTINLSGNRITALPNLSANTAITALNVSRNKLEFATLEANATIAGIVYSPQDSVDVKESVLKQLGTDQTFSAVTSGSSNSYQWKKNGTAIAGATTTSLTINNIGFKDDAVYFYEATSSIVTGLTLTSRLKTLRVSSLERDSIALRTLYNTTAGANWTNKTNWLTTPLETGNWFGITISGNRVTQVKLPNNNLKGPVSSIVSDIQNLQVLDLSNNKITSLPNLTSIAAINTLNVSSNNLDFSSLITNASIKGINYLNQAVLGAPLDTLVNVGSPVQLKVLTNTPGNVYQWKRNGVSIPGATANTFSIGEISRSNSGIYINEITNLSVPGLTLRSAPKKATAVANISGRLLVSPTSPVTKGQMLLLKINPVGIAFDTTRVELVKTDGTYSLKSVVLDDYILIGQGDREVYKDYFPTYFKSSVFWEEADTIKLNESRSDLNITLTSLPALPKGEGILSGVFEEETSGGRVEGRGRVSGASVTVRRQQNAGRPSRTMAEDEIAAFLYTDEVGAFQFENLEEGFYLLNIQYPGVPMDQKSDIIINIGSKARKQNVQKVEALATGGKIVVRRLLIVGLGEEQPSIQIYPNPVSSALFINLTEGSGVAKMKMFDFSGKEVLSQELKEGKTQIDLSSNSAGVYLIKIFRGTKEVTTARLVVD